MLSWMAYDEPPTERELGQSTSNRRHTKKDVSGNDRYGRSQRGMSRCARIRRRSPRVRLRAQARRNGVDIEMTFTSMARPLTWPGSVRAIAASRSAISGARLRGRRLSKSRPSMKMLRYRFNSWASSTGRRRFGSAPARGAGPGSSVGAGGPAARGTLAHHGRAAC